MDVKLSNGKTIDVEFLSPAQLLIVTSDVSAQIELAAANVARLRQLKADLQALYVEYKRLKKEENISRANSEDREFRVAAWKVLPPEDYVKILIEAGQDARMTIPVEKV